MREKTNIVVTLLKMTHFLMRRKITINCADTYCRMSTYLKDNFGESQKKLKDEPDPDIENVKWGDLIDMPDDETWDKLLKKPPSVSTSPKK